MNAEAKCVWKSKFNDWTQLQLLLRLQFCSSSQTADIFLFFCVYFVSCPLRRNGGWCSPARGAPPPPYWLHSRAKQICGSGLSLVKCGPTGGGGARGGHVARGWQPGLQNSGQSGPNQTENGSRRRRMTEMKTRSTEVEWLRVVFWICALKTGLQIHQCR